MLDYVPVRQSLCRLGDAVWEITKSIPDAIKAAIVSHLMSNCRFTFQPPYRLTGEPAPFPGDVLLCQLVLEPGSSLSNAGRRSDVLTAAAFYFLFRPIDEVLIPLTGGVGDILLATRWLGLELADDAQRLRYARLYCGFARMERPPQFHNLPQKISDLRFAGPVSEKQLWGIYGAMWRYLVDATTFEVRAHFESRGAFWRQRYRAHLPMQFGRDLYDVDLKIWKDDGHVSYRKTGLIYRDDALDEEPPARPARIPFPRYVQRGEWLLTLHRNFRTAINQGLYLVAFTLFLIASAVALAFPLEIWRYHFVRAGLEWAAAAVGRGDWTTWLQAACFYCIAYFVLTTLLILDVETLRNALLTWSPRFRGSRLDEFLYGIVVRNQLQNGSRRGLARRVRAAVSWLVFWTVYQVCVFTSLQASLRPRLADDGRALLDVMLLFAEQAMLYIPVVFYYVGRKSLDPAKLELVSLGVLIAFQLIMGLLVIRRIHRFWASTRNAQMTMAPVQGRPALPAAAQ
jgi:hypothetical protein